MFFDNLTTNFTPHSYLKPFVYMYSYDYVRAWLLCLTCVTKHKRMHEYFLWEHNVFVMKVESNSLKDEFTHRGRRHVRFIFVIYVRIPVVW